MQDIFDFIVFYIRILGIIFHRLFITYLRQGLSYHFSLKIYETHRCGILSSPDEIIFNLLLLILVIQVIHELTNWNLDPT